MVGKRRAGGNIGGNMGREEGIEGKKTIIKSGASEKECGLNISCRDVVGKRGKEVKRVRERGKEQKAWRSGRGGCCETQR